MKSDYEIRLIDKKESVTDKPIKQTKQATRMQLTTKEGFKLIKNYQAFHNIKNIIEIPLSENIMAVILLRFFYTRVYTTGVGTETM